MLENIVGFSLGEENLKDDIPDKIVFYIERLELMHKTLLQKIFLECELTERSLSDATFIVTKLSVPTSCEPSVVLAV